MMISSLIRLVQASLFTGCHRLAEGLLSVALNSQRSCIHKVSGCDVFVAGCTPHSTLPTENDWVMTMWLGGTASRLTCSELGGWSYKLGCFFQRCKDYSFITSPPDSLTKARWLGGGVQPHWSSCSPDSTINSQLTRRFMENNIGLTSLDCEG